MASLITQEQRHKCKKCSTPRPEVVVRAPPTRQKSTTKCLLNSWAYNPQCWPQKLGNQKMVLSRIWLGMCFSACLWPWCLMVLASKTPCASLPTPILKWGCRHHVAEVARPQPLWAQNCWGLSSWDKQSVPTSLAGKWAVLCRYSQRLTSLLLWEWLTGECTFSSPNHWRNWEHSYCTKSEETGPEQAF